MKQKAVILDLDGTLCGLKPHEERNNHTGLEKPIDVMYNVYLGFGYYTIIVLTGRKEKYREITEKWLHDNDIHIDHLIMQEGHTAKKNHIFKREKLIELQQEYDILAVVDDNPAMIEVCRGLNIILLQIHTGTFQNVT